MVYISSRSLFYFFKCRSKEKDLNEELDTVKRTLKTTEKELDTFMKKVPDIFSKR